MHSVQGATDGSVLAFDGKRMGIGFGEGIFLGQLLTYTFAHTIPCPFMYTCIMVDWLDGRIYF